MTDTLLRPLGLTFEAAAPPPPPPQRERADIALFVGAIERRRDKAGQPTPLPDAAIATLRTIGLDVGDGALLDRPVEIEGFDAFADLFLPVSRRASATDPENIRLACPLAAAVRAFFEAGGERAWIVRTGDPVPTLADRGQRYAAMREILPGLPPVDQLPDALIVRQVLARGPVSSAPDEWRGIELAFGIPEASFVLLPDLADLLAAPPVAIAPPDAMAAVTEPFIECAAPPVVAPVDAGRRLVPPRFDAAGLVVWQRLIAFARLTLDNGGRAWSRADIQLLGSVPLGGDDAGTSDSRQLLAWLTDAAPVIRSAGISVAYPWLTTAASGDCAGGVEAPEGTFAGMLARSALERGSYRTAARRPAPRIVALEPSLDRASTLDALHPTSLGMLSLADRVSLLLPSPRGPELASDVTLAGDPRQRQGSVRRLVNLIAAEGRAIGEDILFLPSGEALWAQLRGRFSDLGRRLAAEGALAGDDAFEVHCDRTTMTQADLDAGRLIVEILVAPADPIRRIRVVLTLGNAAMPLTEAA